MAGPCQDTTHAQTARIIVRYICCACRCLKSRRLAESCRCGKYRRPLLTLLLLLYVLLVPCDVARLCFVWHPRVLGAVMEDYDYSFSQNGLVAYKAGELIGMQVRRSASFRRERPVFFFFLMKKAALRWVILACII